MPMYGSRNDALGVQKTTLAGGGIDTGMTLYEKELYMKDVNKVNGKYLTIKTVASIGGDQFQSVGKAMTADNLDVDKLNYQKVRINFVCIFIPSQVIFYTLKCLRIVSSGIIGASI